MIRPGDPQPFPVDMRFARLIVSGWAMAVHGQVGIEIGSGLNGSNQPDAWIVASIVYGRSPGAMGWSLEITRGPLPARFS